MYLNVSVKKYTIVIKEQRNEIWIFVHIICSWIFKNEIFNEMFLLKLWNKLLYKYSVNCMFNL